ncbi:MAG: arsenite methyltransferase [Candidatus Aureabacteria bacterium]|nr:arsenite methyltransferase [Candidatus Auribacterota bacterium]
MKGREETPDEIRIREVVREAYAKVAKGQDSCCGPSSSCCSGSTAESISTHIGYSKNELKEAPEGANLGLGCGNPLAHASLKKGEIVLDLGSGGGFDCFLASGRVGERGRVIGVDMTTEMVEKARENARKWGAGNVEFRLGEIEKLPVADASVDVLISNCVINLSPDKPRVFREALRVLKPGGRLMVSDIVLRRELPAAIRDSVSAYVGCISGAVLKDEYLGAIKTAGFGGIEVLEEHAFPIEDMAHDVTAQAVVEAYGTSPEKIRELEDSVASIKVKAVKTS